MFSPGMCPSLRLLLPAPGHALHCRLKLFPGGRITDSGSHSGRGRRKTGVGAAPCGNMTDGNATLEAGRVCAQRLVPLAGACPDDETCGI